MAGPNPVAINIVVNAGSAQEAIAKMRAEIAGLQQAGDGAAKGAAVADKGLAGLKEQMGKGRETAMFFTQALGEFGPQGRTAQIAISGIAGAFLGGGGLIAVLSLAQAAARVFTARQKEMADAAAESRKAIVSLADESIRLGESTKSSAVAAAQAAYLQKQIAELGRRKAGEDEEQAEETQKEIDRLTRERVQLELHIPALRRAEAEAATAARRARAEAEQKEAEAATAAAVAERKMRPEAGVWKDRPTGLAGQTLAMDSLRVSTLGLAEAEERWARASMQALARTPEQIAAAEAMESAYASVGASLSGAAQGMASDFVGAFRPMLTQSAAFSRAMRAAGGAVEDTADLSGAAFAAMAQNALANLAVEAGQRSIFETAMGIAAAATGNPAAAGHFVAAGLFAGIGVGAGVGAYAIGENRGMTAAERAQVQAQRDPQAGVSGGSFGTGTRGEAVNRTTVMVIAHPFMTESEAAAYAARTIEKARSLDMFRREA